MCAFCSVVGCTVVNTIVVATKCINRPTRLLHESLLSNHRLPLFNHNIVLRTQAAILHHTSDMIKGLQKDRERLNAQNARLRSLLDENRNARLEHRRRNRVSRDHALSVSSAEQDDGEEEDADEDEEEDGVEMEERRFNCLDDRLYDDDNRRTTPQHCGHGKVILDQGRAPAAGGGGPRKAHVKLTRQQCHVTSSPAAAAATKRRKCDTG